MTLVLADIMTKKLLTLREKATLEEAFVLLKEHAVRHVPVVDEVTGKLLGLVSDRDVKKLVSPFARTRSATAQDDATLRVKLGAIMKRDLVTGRADDPVKETAEKMLQRKLSCIPVVDEENRLVGIVTSDDMMRTLLRFL